MSIVTSPSNPSTATSFISRSSLLEASNLLLDNLGSPHLTSRSIQWDNFPALLKLWEVLWQAQARLVIEAESVLEELRTVQVQKDEIQELRAELKVIIENKQLERDKHFQLSLYWRRNAIWRFFRTHLQQPEEARDLLHAYLVRPVGGGNNNSFIEGQGQLENCRPKCLTKSEQEVLLSLAGSQRNRIRQLAQWLRDHPAAAALLHDTKGTSKGKGSKDVDGEDVTLKEKLHFERCLDEIEPRSRLKYLLESTKDWIECFIARLETVQEAKELIQSSKYLQTVVESAAKLDDKKTSPSVKIRKRRTSPQVIVFSDQERLHAKRRKTVDRATSPIHEAADASLYLEHDRNARQVSVTMVAAESEAAANAIHTQKDSQEDETPPSPQSLPSPPPHGQSRPSRAQQATTEESQTTTTQDSSAKPVSLPSMRSLPPVQSSSSGDDGFQVILVKETVHSTSLAMDIDAEAVSNTTTLKVEKVLDQGNKKKKKKKQGLRTPEAAPVPLELISVLEAASAEAEKRRKEEKKRLDEYEYDPWADLQCWVPPPASPKSVEPQKVGTMQEGPSNGVMHVEVTHKKSRQTFDTLDEESQSTSNSKRERQEEEARITDFLQSEDL